MQMKPELALAETQRMTWERVSIQLLRSETADHAPLARFCCGEGILPKWAQVKERAGREFSALVWACPHCALVTYHRVAHVPPGAAAQSSFAQGIVAENRSDERAENTR